MINHIEDNDTKYHFVKSWKHINQVRYVGLTSLYMAVMMSDY